MPSLLPSSWRDQGKTVLQIEAAALQALAQRLDHRFEEACTLLLQAKGRAVLCGIGKSGHVARKIAATLASTGTPAFFLHPADAAHGDIGMMTSHDVFLALSYSGESNELLTLLPNITRLGVPLIAMTGKQHSTLARNAQVCLETSVAQEACPFNLSPTASTTVAMALGDALAMTLLQARGFDANDFALSHPAGSLGRRLLIRVRHLMRHGETLPVLSYDAFLKEAVLEISANGLGFTAIIDHLGNVKGIFTDGDLRRVLDHGMDVLTTPISEVMTQNPVSIDADCLAADIMDMMRERRLNSVLVLEHGQLMGVVTMHDLLRARVI